MSITELPVRLLVSLISIMVLALSWQGTPGDADLLAPDTSQVPLETVPDPGVAPPIEITAPPTAPPVTSPPATPSTPATVPTPPPTSTPTQTPVVPSPTSTQPVEPTEPIDGDEEGNGDEDQGNGDEDQPDAADPDALAPAPPATPPVGTPTAPAGPPADGGELVWSGDFEDGVISHTDSNPHSVGAPEPEIVTDPAFVRDGTRAAKFTIPAGGQRNEVIPDVPSFNEGDRYYFGFSMLLADGFPVQDGWQVVTQWKNDGTGSPPLSLNVEDGQFRLGGGYGHPDGPKTYSQDLAPAVTGQWMDWVIGITFSADSASSSIDVWLNNQQILTGFAPPDSGTLYPGLSSYLKTGYYRNTEIGTDGTVYYDNWKVGTSQAAVSRGV